jgi:cold shock CspA family protein
VHYGTFPGTAVHQPVTGTVVGFDEHKGYGTVRADEDGREFFFHCTQITDGSRTIPEGAAVTFGVVAGHLGRWEATGVTHAG